MSEGIKDLFTIRIGCNETDETYGALVHSVTDGKFATIKNTSIRKVMAELNTLVRGKTREVKHFPIPKKNRIITLKQSAPIIVGPNGKALNGRC